ncbi:hypothetical protein QUF76_05465 [Desulfobacterales bacterium HSG16]|nr:hypothetical protein [Desulfobacterales bacterium HSG16]
MKIILNTKYKDAVASTSYRLALSKLEEVECFDWDSYEKYDVALFMPYPEDYLSLVEAKSKCPEIKTGVIDPRGQEVEKYLSYIDFIVIDSIEMKDFFAKFHLPMFCYYEYPDIEERFKQHSPKDRVVIGYHGNKIHLMSMYPALTKALELLGEKYDIELAAMYNIKNLGKWNIGVPENISIKHVQWSFEAYYNELSRADIGIVPALIPIRNLDHIKSISTVCDEPVWGNADDYMIRFKVPSNPGRIAIFSKLGIPVVADMLPSFLQTVQDEHNGFIAYSCAGWYNSLEKLIIDPELRQTFADNMKKTIDSTMDYDTQNVNFLNFLEKMLKMSDSLEKNIFNWQVEGDLSSLFPKKEKNGRTYFGRVKQKINKFLKNISL